MVTFASTALPLIGSRRPTHGRACGTYVARPGRLRPSAVEGCAASAEAGSLPPPPLPMPFQWGLPPDLAVPVEQQRGRNADRSRVAGLASDSPGEIARSCGHAVQNRVRVGRLGGHLHLLPD